MPSFCPILGLFICIGAAKVWARRFRVVRRGSVYAVLETDDEKSFLIEYGEHETFQAAYDFVISLLDEEVLRQESLMA